MSVEKPKSQNEIDYPSVDLAYKLAVESYDTAHKRWEAADSRLQTLLTFTVTVELALPALLHTNNPKTSFRSLWFIFAVIAFVFSVGIGVFARLKKGLILINPKELYEDWLGYSEWEFKKNFIYFAAKDYETNKENVNNRIEYTVAMLILFLVGSFLLIFWAISAAP